LKLTVLLAMLAMSSAPPAVAQTRIPGGTSQPRATVGPRPADGHARPAPAAAPPFRSTLVFTPTPAPHSTFPVRLPWFGLVLFDPYWAPTAFGQISPLPMLPAVDDERPKGGLQLDVDPRRALVYVDGRLAGVVESFSGYYQHLDLPGGLHQIELLANGYDPLVIEVVVSPGRTTTYRGSLGRARDHD
jgi:hypothetical protein